MKISKAKTEGELQHLNTLSVSEKGKKARANKLIYRTFLALMSDNFITHIHRHHETKLLMVHSEKLSGKR